MRDPLFLVRVLKTDIATKMIDESLFRNDEIMVLSLAALVKAKEKIYVFTLPTDRAWRTFD